MKENTSLLDCTLRDGVHVVGGCFGEEVIKNVIKKLIEAEVDIIEIGFISTEGYSADYANFRTIADVKRILPKKRGGAQISVMSNHVDISHLEQNDGTIDMIRLAFKRQRIDWAFESMRILTEKGYKCSLNPVNCNVYSDFEYLELLKRINEIKPHSFSIVDTFGVMRKDDLSRLYYIVENNLHPDINIGLHLHDNLGMAYSLAQHFIEISSPTRHINIDCSLLGMGRAPGNLFSEHIMDYLNTQYGKKYDTEPAFDAADDYIAPIKRQIPWGYATPYALSAKYKLHRTYAEYLMGKGRLKTKDMQRILSRVESGKAELFDEGYIESLYIAYMSADADSVSFAQMKQKFTSFEEVVILAPGASINQNAEAIKSYISASNACVAAVNFNPGNFNADLVFCTNIRRYERITMSNSQELVITSNLLEYAKGYNYVVPYNSAVCHDDVYCDDSTLMLMNLLRQIGINKVAVAGFDGYKEGTRNFYTDSFEKRQNLSYPAERIKQVLKRYLTNMDITFLTRSQLEA